jgi:hypothetical protein
MHPHQRDKGDMMGFAGRIRRRTLLSGTAIAVGGGLVGAVVAASVSASAAATTAATLTSASSPSATASSVPGAQHNGARAGHPGAFGLNLTGTVTSVSSNSVTIKTSSGAIKTYKVDATSDIDKNGEAQLSSLAVRDEVRYSLDSGTNTIDKLHAGSEAKDAPGRPMTGMPGHPGTGSGAKDASSRPAAPNAAAPSGAVPGGQTSSSGA